MEKEPEQIVDRIGEKLSKSLCKLPELMLHYQNRMAPYTDSAKDIGYLHELEDTAKKLKKAYDSINEAINQLASIKQW